jgi:hypothetical protein
MVTENRFTENRFTENRFTEKIAIFSAPTTPQTVGLV